MRATLVSVSILFVFTIVSACNGNSSVDEIIYINELKEARIEKNERENMASPHTIACIPRVTGIPYYDAVLEGALEASGDLDIEIVIPDAIVGYEDQIRAIEEFIVRDIEAIAISAADPYKLIPVLKKAQQHQIRVITWDSDIDETARDYFVNMVDSETLGKHLMDMLASTINEVGEYAIISSSFHAASTNDWIKWMKIQQKQYYPDINLLHIVPSNDNYDTAYQVALRFLQDYPNLSAIVGISTVAPPAAARAVMEEGRQVKVLGLSLPNEMREYIEEGVAENITLWSPQKLGYLTVTLTRNILNGKEPVDQQEIPNVGYIRVKDNVVVMGEPIIFTKENIKEYEF